LLWLFFSRRRSNCRRRRLEEEEEKLEIVPSADSLSVVAFL